MEPIHKKIGRNLLAIRKNRSLSLDRVSELTGVSKAMLGQIERGESNPTISVLWKIVNGLHISFTSLIEEEPKSVSVVRIDELTPFEENNGQFRSYPLFPFDQNKRFEIYLVELSAGCTHESEPHNEGVEEYVFAVSGELRVTVQDETFEVQEGNAIRFNGDLPHWYVNRGNRPVKFLTLIYYPS